MDSANQPNLDFDLWPASDWQKFFDMLHHNFLFQYVARTE